MSNLSIFGKIRKVYVGDEKNVENIKKIIDRDHIIEKKIRKKGKNMILSVSDRVEFWDTNVWHYLVQIGIILLAIICGNIIRRKVKLIQNSLLPSSVIAGILIFIFKFIPAVNKFISLSEGKEDFKSDKVV